jgi:hypothetical protein
MIATERRIVKRRMDEYLWWEKSAANVRLRSVLRKHFLDFDRVAIVGGMVRDIARAGKRGFHSDIDLVVEAPAEAVTELAIRNGARRNQFGGYSFSEDGWKLDFWALETTWAAREGHVQVRSLEDITQCTFFDWDAILYDLKARKVICSESYLDRVHRKTMDISLLANPSYLGNLYRAVHRILAWDLQPGPKLTAFIDEHLDDDGFQSIVQEESKRCKRAFLNSFGDARTLHRYLTCSDDRKQISTAYAKQMSLPGVLH